MEIMDKPKFIESWASRYYSYTSISDSIYHYIKVAIQKEKDLKNTIMLLGAWKTNALSTNGTGDMAFDCECGGKYYFTQMWKEGTSSAFEIWNNLDQCFKHHKNLLKEGKTIKIVKELSDKRYSGAVSKSTRFGMIYAIIYLHFLDNSYPILDKFVLKALKEIFKNKDIKDIKTPEQYFEEFIPLYKEFVQGYKGASRNIDKALWAFGHYISKSKKIKQQPCCRI